MNRVENRIHDEICWFINDFDRMLINVKQGNVSKSHALKYLIAMEDHMGERIYELCPRRAQEFYKKFKTHYDSIKNNLIGGETQ